jgi:small subunit ribosomal protein S27Ae
MGKKRKESKRKGKKKPSKRPVSKKSALYKKEGEVLKKSRMCPKCGPGVFLADHKNRFSCGRCGYTEFKR